MENDDNTKSGKVSATKRVISALKGNTSNKSGAKTQTYVMMKN